MSQQQASVPVSPLRRRMLDDMAMRGLYEDTQCNYIMSVRNFAAFLGRSPETATPEDVRRFQIHQADSGVQPPTINNTVSGLRFLFNVTLDRPDLSRRLVLARYSQKLPNVLNCEEVGRLLEAARGPKYRAALGVAYGAGLRVSEVVGLRTADIDSTRMLIRVEQGKGRKDRNAMLSPQLLELLRQWWREGRRRGVMLPRVGCSPARTAWSRCRRASSAAPSTRRRRWPASRSASRPIRCATASPPTCSSRTSTSASSRSCSAIPSSTPPRSTPAWRPARSGR